MADWPYGTTTWQHLRRKKLEASPYCEACAMRGVRMVARHVDHVRSIASGGEPFPPLAGLMALCPPCHSVKTAAVDRPGGSGVRFPGVGVDGLPIDPDHPFLAGGIPPRRTAGMGHGTDQGGSSRVSPESKKPRRNKGFDPWD